MKLHKASFANTHSFSPFFLDYIQQKQTLKSFYNRFPSLDAFSLQIEDKGNAFPISNREVLVSVLLEQYSQVKAPDVVKQNIDSLASEKTFTITTGHQLNLCTGPLYFIYKIVTVINVCKELKKEYPDYHFVPMYWMASEDHDFEEINYFKLDGKKYKWSTDQAGAVGRFNPNTICSLLDEVPGDTTIFRNAYSTNTTLSAAVRSYVNELLGNEGIVVIDADDSRLKEKFKDVVKDDLFNHTAKVSVEEKNSMLEGLGYSPQIFAREINFFYLEDSSRNRLERVSEGFQIVDTGRIISTEEAEQLICHETSKFSPNVVLRPLYQEMILPNLAYVGGPAEVVYWLQLKGVFDHYKVPFPMVMPRNFALIIDEPNLRKWSKTGFGLDEIFQEKNELFVKWIKKNTHHNLSLEDESAKIGAMFSDLKERSTSLDVTLGPMVEAEEKRMMKAIHKIEQKFLRAEKRNHKEKLGQIESVKEALFPNGSPQERTENFLRFYQQDKNFIDELIQHFDPFDYSFNVLTH